MLCPKCHRPLDDDGVHICCADSSLQWRCTQCAKVSEGFAVNGVFFASDRAGYVTGKVLSVSGGLTMAG